MLPRQDSPPPPVDYANSDQLLFPSEASLTQISLLDDQSLNILAESPAFHPSTSVASFDQSDFNQILLEQVKSPLPNDTLQPPLPRTNGLSSSLSDRESRLEYQFESMSLADGNVSGLFGTDEKQEPSSSKSFTQKNDEKEARSTTLTLKEQEKTIDTLKKENFGLKLKIYYLEKRLDDLSPDQVDNALKENVDLKVNIQTLTQELRKYKKIILELHSAMDILQNSNQPCTLPHGMSPEEEAEYNAALSSASQHRDENERLHKMIADVSAENARLRASVRSSRTSSPLMGGLKLSRSNSGSGSSGSRPMDDFVDEDKWMLHRRLANNKNMANEAEFFKREWLQAKQTIEKQNETIRLLREENSFKANNAASGDSQLVKSILSDRDALVTKTERYAKMNQELQQDISKMRERNTEMVAQLLAKNKELDNVHANMDELVKSLNEAKQQLRTKTSECQQLRAELATYRGSPNGENVMERLEKLKQENKDHVATIDKLKRDIEEQKSAHQKEIEKLDAEIEQRELEFVKLEKEVVKIMARAEKLESREREKDALIVELEQKLERTADGAYEEELERLEQELRIKDETIAKYERRMERSDAHEDDIATLEERFAEVEATIKQKDAQIQQLEDEMEETLTKAEEAKARYEEDLQELERQFQEIERGLRERDVRIASLEGHLEAQTDAIQREKQIYQEEIKELEDKLQELAELLREKDMLLEHMEEQMEHRVAGARDAAQAYEDDLADIKEDMASRMIEAEEEWQARLADLEERLRETEEKLKKERRLANEKISEAVAAKRTLQQKLESANMKNGLLNDLLDQYQRSSESRNGSRSTQANQVLTKLNQELQRELEDRDRALERESQRVQELDALCARAMEEKEQLEELLIRRNSMITRLFERLESTKERKTVMENVLLRQATDEIDVSYNRRSDSALSSR